MKEVPTNERLWAKSLSDAKRQSSPDCSEYWILDLAKKIYCKNGGKWRKVV